MKVQVEFTNSQEEISSNNLSTEGMLPRGINCLAIAATIHWEKLCEIRGV